MQNILYLIIITKNDLDYYLSKKDKNWLFSKFKAKNKFE